MQIFTFIITPIVILLFSKEIIIINYEFVIIFALFLVLVKLISELTDIVYDYLFTYSTSIKATIQNLLNQKIAQQDPNKIIAVNELDNEGLDLLSFGWVEDLNALVGITSEFNKIFAKEEDRFTLIDTFNNDINNYNNLLTLI
jgi:hypothetical protein